VEDIQVAMQAMFHICNTQPVKVVHTNFHKNLSVG